MHEPSGLPMILSFLRKGSETENVNNHDNGTNSIHHKIGHKHGEGFSIDFYAYNSRIRNWNSGFKVLFPILVLILCTVLDNPYVSTVIIAAMAYLTVIKGGLPVHEYLSIMSIPITFIVISVFAIAVDFSKQPVGQYNLYLGLGYMLTSQAMIKRAGFLILKVFAAVSALQMMALSTPSSEIISVLEKAHVPKIIVELMNIIYRYIFILTDLSINMKNSAESRQGYCDFKTSCYTFGNIAGNILVISLKKANAYYDAMEARCYDGDLVFLQEDKRVDRMQVALAAAFIAALFLIWGFTS